MHRTHEGTAALNARRSTPRGVCTLLQRRKALHCRPSVPRARSRGASVLRTHAPVAALHARRSTPKGVCRRKTACGSWLARWPRCSAGGPVRRCGPRTCATAPPTARPSPPPPPHPSPLLPLRPPPRLRGRHSWGSSGRLESPRSTSPCCRKAAARSATRSPAPHPPPPPLSDRPPQSQGRRLAGRAPCRPHSPPPHRRPPHRSPSPPPPPCGSIPSMAQCASLMLGCPAHVEGTQLPARQSLAD